MIDCDEREKQGDEAPEDMAADAVCAYKGATKDDVLGSFTGTNSDGEAPEQDGGDI